MVPLLWFTPARKTLLFCLIAMAVAWFQMAITKGAGDGAHHVVLLWPLPQWFITVAFVEASRWKPLQWRKAGAVALGAAMVFLAGENLLLTNEYFYQVSHFGALGGWSDAIYQLSDEVGRMRTAHFLVDDWGIVNPLVVLHGGNLSISMASDPAPGTEDIWIGHTPEFEQRPQATEAIVQSARAAGFEKQILRTVSDREGHAVFEVFRFVRATN
jgi:hypothetical protein